MSYYRRFTPRIEHTNGKDIERVVLLMENSQKVTLFQATYSPNFEDTTFVKEVISNWQNGEKTFILKSSGSTGQPKKIALSRQLLVWSAESTLKALELNRVTTYNQYCCLPVTKTGGFMQLIRALHFGWHIHFVKPSNRPLQSDTTHIDLISLTPSQMQHSLAQDTAVLATAKAILIGGAAIDDKLFQQIVSFTTKTKIGVWQTYGMTETASHIALQKIGQHMHFKPQPGVDITLENNQLCIGIDQLDLHLKTKDLAILYSDGFAILGRTDDVINSGGIKVHPALLEPIILDLLSHAGIHRAFYLTKKTDNALGEKVVLVVEGTPLKEESFVLEMLKRELPAYQHPKEIVFVRKIAYTDTGKVIRKSIV